MTDVYYVWSGLYGSIANYKLVGVYYSLEEATRAISTDGTMWSSDSDTNDDRIAIVKGVVGEKVTTYDPDRIASPEDTRFFRRVMHRTYDVIEYKEA